MAEPLTITERHDLALATIMARRNVAATALGPALGVCPPAEPGYARGDGLAVIGTGPGTWLALAEPAAPNWPAQLEERLAGLAAVSDQSGAYVVLRIAGPAARTLLQRGVFIDLHPDAFSAGSAATTSIAHIGVILWQPDEAPIFEVALFRSYASSFRHWIDTTVATL